MAQHPLHSTIEDILKRRSPHCAALVCMQTKTRRSPRRLWPTKGHGAPRLGGTHAIGTRQVSACTPGGLDGSRQAIGAWPWDAREGPFLACWSRVSPQKGVIMARRVLCVRESIGICLWRSLRRVHGIRSVSSHVRSSEGLQGREVQGAMVST